jgi:membrane protein YqaA with SNARE-associated domain
MNPIIESLGYLGLFIIALISFTIFPGPSDATVAGMIIYGAAPWLVILVASAGGIIARVINYMLGNLGEEYVVEKKRWLKPKQVAWSKKMFHKYGTAILLMTWFPFFDDPLTLVAGFFGFPFKQYLLYTSIGVFIRHIGIYLLFRFVCVQWPDSLICSLNIFTN